MFKEWQSWWRRRVGVTTKPALAWHFALAAQRPAIGRLNDALEQVLLAHIPESALRSLQVALDELLTNVIMHAIAVQGMIELDLKRGDGLLETTIEYRAEAFDPTGTPSQARAGSIADSPIGGLGLHLVHTLMDDFRHEYCDGCNRLYLRQRL